MRAVLLIGVLVISSLFTNATPARAIQPSDCSEQDLSEETGITNGINVVYDEHNLVDQSLGPNAAAYATTIAEAVRSEAIEANVQYEALGLGQDVSSALRIELRCNPLNSPAITPGPGLIQIDVNLIREELRGVVVESARVDANPAYVPQGPSLQDGIWQTADFRWADILHHEMFHTLQWNMVGVIDFLNDYASWLDHTRYESSAVLAQDLFGADGDDPSVVADDLGQDQANSYWRFTRRLFGEASKPSLDMWTFHTDSTGTSRAYQAAAIFQYFGEQFGDPAEGDLEARAAKYLRDMIVAEGQGLEPIQASIGRDIFDAVRDFWMVAYAHDRGAQADQTYQLLDEQLNTTGAAGGAPQYPRVAIGPDDSGQLGDTFAFQQVDPSQGRIYEVSLPAGTELVEVGLDSHVVGVDFTAGDSYLAAIPVDVAGGSETAVIERANRWRAGSDALSGVENSPLIPVAGHEKLAVVVVGTDRNQFDLTVQDGGSLPDIQISEPTQESPLAIGPGTSLQQLEIQVDGVGADLPAGLGAASWQVEIGGNPVVAVTPTYLFGSYELIVQPTGPLSDGFHDLAVTLGDFTATEPDAVLVGDSPHAAVAIVIDNSGSMSGAEIVEAKSAAIGFVQGMELGDEVAVVTFNSTAANPPPQALIELASESIRDQVITAIQGITATGGTNIGSGITMGNTQLSGASTGFARAQILLSDGFDGFGSTTETAIQNTPVDIDIHTIALTTASDQELLADIAERTGGTFHFAPSPSDLTDLYRLIRAAIGSDETSANGSLGVLGQGDEQSAEFIVSSGVGTLSAQLDWVGSDFDLVLTAPSGRVITETTSDPDVNVVAGPTHVAIEVTTPEVGQWSLEATGIDVQTAQEVTYRVEESGSSIRSRLYLSGAETAGEPMQIRLALTDGSSAVVGATVLAHVTDPVGQTRMFRMSDDGAQADGRADDGVYGASVLGTNAAGSYTVRVTASGADGNDELFTRIESGSLFAAAMVDGDGDGIADDTESAIGLDPLDPADGSEDHDADGVTTAAEIAMGSDPSSPDTDQGGESDGSEAAGGRDPLDASDDLDIASAFLDPRPVDGRIVEIALASDDGTGTVKLTRIADGARTALGSHPGSGSIVTDGPLAAGSYEYEAIVVSPAGTMSAPTRSGPVIVADDVTPPAARLFLNGGASVTSSLTISAEFLDESENLTEMRLAMSEDGLASAAWQTFADPTSISVGPDPGTYTVYAQVRDTAGLPSEVTSATVVFTAPLSVVTERVSESSQHGQGNGLSHEAYISADGRYVTFESEASDLVSGDTNAAADVFVHDRVTDTTTRVSVASDGTQANGSSEDPTISPDGRWVAFRSAATNLVAGDTNNKYDIFVHDRQTGTTTRVSVTNSGGQATGASDSPVVARDGAAVVFRSFASNLVAGDTNGETDIFVRDLVAGTTTRVSVSSGGVQGNAGTDGPTISDDGRFVAFDSTATTLVGGDTNAVSDVFLHDRQLGTTGRVSVAAGGTQANAASWEATLDADGSTLAFQSGASNLVAGDTNAKDDAFVVTVATGAIVRASVGDDEAQSNNHAGEASLSADGTLLAFFSSADNLVAGDTNGKGDVFVRDLANGTTTRWSVATDGTQANDRSTNPTIAGAGHTVAFHSFATNLVPNDTNAVADVFVRGPDQ